MNGPDICADSEISTLHTEQPLSPAALSHLTTHSHPSTPKDFDYNPGSIEVVGWDGPDDSANPRNWTKRRRWVVTLVVSLFTFIR